MYYVYRLFNKKSDVIYVGRTKDINRRFAQHIGEATKVKWKREIMGIDYAEFEKEIDSVIAEIYYISKFSPKYNVEFRNMGTSSIVECNFNFKELSKKTESRYNKDFIVKLYNFYVNVKRKGPTFTPVDFINFMGMKMEEWQDDVKFFLLNDLKCIKNSGGWNFSFIDSAMDNVKKDFKTKVKGK